MAASIFRFFTIAIMSPILAKMGYGLNWKYTAVLIWSQFRDVSALLICIDFSQSRTVQRLYGDKIVVITSAVVMLSQLTNHITMLYVIKFLGVDSVSAIQKRAMIFSINRIRDVVMRSIHINKSDGLLVSAHWDWITRYTVIEDPYASKTAHEMGKQDVHDVSIPVLSTTYVYCPVCREENKLDENKIDTVSKSAQNGKLTVEELSDLKEQAYYRAINVTKLFYRKLYHDGIIGSYVATKLTFLGEIVLEHPGRYIEFDDLKKQYVLSKFYYRIKNWIDARVTSYRTNEFSLDWRSAWDRRLKGKNLLYSGKRNVLRRQASNIISHPHFEKIILSLIVFCLLLIILHAFLVHHQLKLVVDVFLGLFILSVILEILLKVIAFGPNVFWSCYSNKMDTVIVIVAFLTLIFVINDTDAITSKGAIHAILSIPCVLSSFHLVIFVMIKVRNVAASNYDEQIYKNYNFSEGLESGQKIVLRKLSQITDCEEVSVMLKDSVNSIRTWILQEMSIAFQMHPEVIVATKTHLACKRIILHAMNDFLKKKNTALLDADYEAIADGLNHLLTEVSIAPPNLSISLRCIDIVCGTKWLDTQLYRHIKPSLIFETHPPGTVIVKGGTITRGVYVIKSGLVKISGSSVMTESDLLPTTSSIMYFFLQPNEKFVDYLVVSQTLGLLSAITNRPSVTESICETVVETILVPTETINYIIEQDYYEYPSLLYTAWRSISLNIALQVLKTSTHYGSLSDDDIRSVLSDAVFPNFEKCNEFCRTESIKDIILIQGKLEDARTNKPYYGPVYIPRSVTLLHFMPIDSRPGPVILLLITTEHYELSSDLAWTTSNIDELLVCRKHYPSIDISPMLEDRGEPEKVTPEEVITAEKDEEAKELEYYENLDSSIMNAPRISDDLLIVFRHHVIQREMALKY